MTTMDALSGLVEEARDHVADTIALRRSVHRHPEVGLQLPRTQRVVLDGLDGLGLDPRPGRSLSSVVAVLDGASPGPTVLLRADMDALPLAEESGVEFASEVDGAMHACGHDTHVAMLLGAARLLAARRRDIAGRVIFMFQPGEEGHHGARHMIEEGVLEAGGRPVERALALHITATATSGVITSRPGPIMASADAWTATVTGRGGHGAMPYHAVDPVPAAAAMVGALQTMVTRRFNVFDPAVLTVGRITAGTTSNVIPETAELEGTVRTMSDEVRKEVLAQIPKVCEHIAAAHGCTVSFAVTHGYPPTRNDDVVAARVLELAAAVLGARFGPLMADPLMAAEDFSYVLQKVPGTLAFLGACPPGVEPDEAPPNHSNRVHFDESALAHGVAMYAAFALDALR
jgi:amidohydrolase